MSLLGSIISRAVESAGAGVTKVADKTVLLKTVDLPNGWGNVKVYPIAYRVYLTKQVVDQMTGVEAEQLKNFGSGVADVISEVGGPVGAVAQVVKLYIEVEWFAIRLAANEEGVTLRGQYLPPTPVLIPTPGNS